MNGDKKNDGCFLVERVSIVGACRSANIAVLPAPVLFCPPCVAVQISSLPSRPAFAVSFDLTIDLARIAEVSGLRLLLASAS